ncbi:hypothetical protein GCK72_021972 [Caenorhabditis remanei]|uniref:Uncharacterized protein n=1 Tax=Caenorhabditis remanei TaxID=31234 RepID=A0A6A5GL78_CAERE|nr:hypothetical protein GCK72_021972 [Caenorhabditis remanei]KAF1755403.1 hypothetical protein GCK72_021972 [Caenorhabditis remanei]
MEIPLVRMSWKTIVPLDENLAGKALSVSMCPVPGCLGWGNVLRHKNAFHRTEEACPVAAHMRKLRQHSRNPHPFMATAAPPAPFMATAAPPAPPPHPTLGLQDVKMEEDIALPPPPPPPHFTLPPPPIQMPNNMPAEPIRLAYITTLSTGGAMSSTMLDFTQTFPINS